MRIAISGTSNQGKSTLIRDFLLEWPTYKFVGNNYRELIDKEKIPHSKSTTKESQWKILNCILDEMQKYTSKDNVIFDRCTLDNLVYSLWSFDKQTSNIDKEFIDISSSFSQLSNMLVGVACVPTGTGHLLVFDKAKDPRRYPLNVINIKTLAISKLNNFRKLNKID